MTNTQAVRDFKKALTTNATDTSFASKVPTLTEPVNDGVIDLPNVIGEVSSKIMILPYGLGADNDAFSMRVIGWRKIVTSIAGVATALWIPVPLITCACTISAVVGVASSPVLATERFADTITVTDDFTPDIVAYEVKSPTGDIIARLVLELFGFAKLEFTFDQTTNTPTMNALWTTY